jgi:hypothetical protein
VALRTAVEDACKGEAVETAAPKPADEGSCGNAADCVAEVASARLEVNWQVRKARPHRTRKT